ncbi:trehalose-phosphatase, partial [Coemansia reversa NRRL 1564]
RLLLLNYDGTLSATQTIPEFARPSPLVLRTLRRLTEQRDTLVYVASGRVRAHMARWFDGIDVGLVAEHGLFFRHPQAAGLGEDWHCLVEHSDPQWRATVLPLFQHYTERTPGSFIEEKEVDIAWHYRNTDPEFGVWQANELRINLQRVLSHLPLSIVDGRKTVEVRPTKVEKAAAFRAILNALAVASPPPAFAMAIGDSKSDERVFSLLNGDFAATIPNLVTCTVGRKSTHAKYFLPDVESVLNILAKLADGKD